ncbi:hypothetical protein AB0F81_41500 [Actinoplanes sp. NPDC024001]|uniref:hypothetical protein n=1 Tax=Actinoplanes sp. NPDC024001 TaxID=3154598 RepID=UPI0033C137C8
MRRPLTAAVALSVLLAAGACSSDAGPAATVTSTPAPVTAATSAAAPVEETSVPLDAGAVLTRLKAAGLGLAKTAVQDEDTDPNNLLGRPNGYLSRASADLPGGDTGADAYSVDRGLVVEAFADAEAAKRRSDYIQGLQKDNPVLGTEWHYLCADGTVLVRVSGNVKPSRAKKIEAAVTGL